MTNQFHRFTVELALKKHLRQRGEECYYDHEHRMKYQISGLLVYLLSVHRTDVEHMWWNKDFQYVFRRSANGSIIDGFWKNLLNPIFLTPQKTVDNDELTSKLWEIPEGILLKELESLPTYAILPLLGISMTREECENLMVVKMDYDGIQFGIRI